MCVCVCVCCDSELVMAQWQTLSRLCQQDSRVQQRVIELYRRINFPYKLRSHFSTWIEQQDWLVETLLWKVIDVVATSSQLAACVK